MLHLPLPRFLTQSQRKTASSSRQRNEHSPKKRQSHRWFFEQLEIRLVPSTLTTDKIVYAATETAVLHLAGFQTGETVALQVVRTDGVSSSRHASPGWLAVDGGAGDFDGSANGQLTVHFTVPDDVTLDSFQVTATGKT